MELTNLMKITFEILGHIHESTSTFETTQYAEFMITNFTAWPDLSSLPHFAGVSRIRGSSHAHPQTIFNLTQTLKLPSLYLLRDIANPSRNRAELQPSAWVRTSTGAAGDETSQLTRIRVRIQVYGHVPRHVYGHGIHELAQYV